MSVLLESIIKASERAANIARACKNEKELNDLLIVEKTGDEANPRFARDFKTLADVLAQECARHEIMKKVAPLGEHIRGEESNILNGVKIKLGRNERETSDILSAVPGVISTVATRLAAAAHASPTPKLNGLPTPLPQLDYSSLGVWIDPIDGTAEFISGVSMTEEGRDDELVDKNKAEWNARGLQCVTVLIGAYSRIHGLPLFGVINQPFYPPTGRILWGVCYSKTKKYSGIPNITQTGRTILVSSAECEDVKAKLAENGWKVENASGAGHKLMHVALGNVAASIVSRSTTYHWDTCGPHAILRSLGGDIVSMADLKPISYASRTVKKEENDAYCNMGGILAYRSEDILNELIKILELKYDEDDIYD